MTPRIIEVKANEDFTLDLTYENGEEKIFDVKPYLSIGVFKQLKDFSLFKKVKPFYGSIAWKSGQDLSPETLYLDSKKNYHSSSKSSSLVAAEPQTKYYRRKAK